MTATSANFAKLLFRSSLFAGLLLGSLTWSGCSSMGGQLSFQTVASMSPAPEIEDPGTAMRQADDFKSAHPGTQIALGSGDSMMPLYKDNTLIVILKVPMSELRRGMTVVYVSREGWPVAHALVEKTDGGWVTMGLNNANCDSETMVSANYAGVVVKAYQCNMNPMLALSRELSTDTVDMATVNPAMTDIVATDQPP